MLATVPMVLIGKKVDLRGSVELEFPQGAAIKLSEKLTYESIYEVPYIETSAKTGFNIDHTFAKLFEAMETYRLSIAHKKKNSD